MTTIQETNKLLQQLEVLTTEEINLVIAFVEFLQYKRSLQPQSQEKDNTDRDLGWTPGFFERTAGAWQGEPLERGDQGECDRRDWSLL